MIQKPIIQNIFKLKSIENDHKSRISLINLIPANITIACPTHCNENTIINGIFLQNAYLNGAPSHNIADIEISYADATKSNTDDS